MHVQNVDPTWVSTLVRIEVPVVMHALASLLTEPRDHTAQSYMPIWCVIGRFCNIVTVCQLARYRSFSAV